MSEAAGLGDKRVLVVDDDEMIRTLIHRVLTRMKIENVEVAASGEQALERLALASFDLLICDWTMPGMSGIELFGRVHASQPDLPFLMLTGRADEAALAAAKSAGISAFVVKPVSPQELKSKIAGLLARGA